MQVKSNYVIKLCSSQFQNKYLTETSRDVDFFVQIFFFVFICLQIFLKELVSK